MHILVIDPESAASAVKALTYAAANDNDSY
jgi:hypothetical protein